MRTRQRHPNRSGHPTRRNQARASTPGHKPEREKEEPSSKASTLEIIWKRSPRQELVARDDRFLLEIMAHARHDPAHENTTSRANCSRRRGGAVAASLRHHDADFRTRRAHRNVVEFT